MKTRYGGMRLPLGTGGHRLLVFNRYNIGESVYKPSVSFKHMPNRPPLDNDEWEMTFTSEEHKSIIIKDWVEKYWHKIDDK